MSKYGPYAVRNTVPMPLLTYAVTDDYIIVLKPDCKAGSELVIKFNSLPVQIRN
jgi:hypothetical protein